MNYWFVFDFGLFDSLVGEDIVRMLVSLVANLRLSRSVLKRDRSGSRPPFGGFFHRLIR